MQTKGVLQGPVPVDLVTPANDPIGVRLLQKMGWKPGTHCVRLHRSLYAWWYIRCDHNRRARRRAAGGTRSAGEAEAAGTGARAL